MHNLVHDALSQGIDRELLLGGERSQTPAHPIDFALANGLQLILQRKDSRHNSESLQPLMEALHFHTDDLLRAIGFLLAIREMSRCRVLQIVNVVNEDTVHLVHFRINVARHCDVDKKHRAILASSKE